MSFSGLKYTLNQNLGNNKRLMVYYDFASGSGTKLMPLAQYPAEALPYKQAVQNQEPATDTGAFSGIIYESNGGDYWHSELFATGEFLRMGYADLTKSNLRVNTSGGFGSANASMSYGSCSALFDVQFNEEISDGILFGSLEKTSTEVNNETVTGAKGFNFGINSRGKLFYQGFDQGGDYIYTVDSIELSKRNLIAFSLDSNELEVSRMDYLNEKIQTESFRVDTKFMADNDRFYLGGGPTYFKGGTNGPSGEFKTFSGQINEFALFSGYLSPPLMMNIGSGILGDYFMESGAGTMREKITGYTQVTTYKTGITGYENEVTGQVTISTGREAITGGLTADGSKNTGEGDKYFKYYTLDNGSVKTYYKEEIGWLQSGSYPDSGSWQYEPTGQGAHATLGLLDISGYVDQYVEIQGISGGLSPEDATTCTSVTINLYDSKLQTGVLSEISGVSQVPLTNVEMIPATPTSGITLLGDSTAFKKDFIYFLGQRK